MTFIFFFSFSFEKIEKIGYHSNFDFECNRERGFKESLSIAPGCIGSFTLPSYEYWEMMQRLLFIFLAWEIVLLVMDKDKMMPLTSGTVSLVPTLHFSTVQFIWKKILIASIAQHHSDLKVDTLSDAQNMNTCTPRVAQFVLVQFLV